MTPLTKLALVLLVIFITTSSQIQGRAQGLDGLRRNIPGEPGQDYPIYSTAILRKLNPGMFGGGHRQGGQQRGQQGGQHFGNQQQQRRQQQQQHGGQQRGQQGGQQQQYGGQQRGQQGQQGGQQQHFDSQQQQGGQQGQQRRQQQQQHGGQHQQQHQRAPQQQQFRSQQQQQQGSASNTQSHHGGNNNFGSQSLSRGSGNQNVPGIPGKDYPTHSLSSLRSRFPTLQLAPDNLIVKDYPRGNTGGSVELPRSSGGSRRTFRPNNGNNNELFSPEYCPGGNIENCIDFCPSSVYAQCVQQCGQTC